jgi:hypothetical protein
MVIYSAGCRDSAKADEWRTQNFVLHRSSHSSWIKSLKNAFPLGTTFAIKENSNEVRQPAQG